MNFFKWKYKGRNAAQRIVFAGLLLYLLFAGFNGGFISCLQNPELKYLSVDNTFWLAHIIGLPQFFSAYFPSVALQSVMMLTGVLAIIFPGNRWFPFLFWLSVTLFGITFYSYSGSHNHDLMALWLLPIPFLVKKLKSFDLLFEGLRYYFLFTFVSAACWKIFRGHVFDHGHMVKILKQQLVHKLSYGFDSFTNAISYTLINNPSFSKTLLYLTIGLQLSFIIGFFTKKMDGYLVFVVLLFVISNVFVMNIFSFAYLLFVLTLIAFVQNKST